MTKCSYPGCINEEYLYCCKYCNKEYCSKHRLPENHKCKILEEHKSRNKERWIKIILEYFGHPRKEIKKQRYKKMKIKLKGKDREEYFVDSKRKQIARVRCDRKIYVNERFEELPLKDKQVIIYHERGHSKFSLWYPITHIIAPFHLTITMLLLFFSLFFLGFGFVLKFNFFGINRIIWLFVFVVGVLNFVAFVTSNYLLEIIADSNAVKKMGKKVVIETIEKVYENKKPEFWSDKIMHPHGN